jgi:CheY-like chemotaxis protein
VNGKMAFERYIQSHQDIDLVFMDCEMPIMDGYEATRLIRQFELENQLPDKPIIAVTAHVFDAHIEKIKQCGMNHQINKPYTDEEIAAALAHFVMSDDAADVH